MLTLSLSAMRHRTLPAFAAMGPRARKFVDRCPHCGCVIVSWPEEGPAASPMDLLSDQRPCCALCHLAQNLERCEIDREAILIWAPEFTQGALNALAHRIHRIAATHGKPVFWSPDPPPANSPEDLFAASSAYAALVERSVTAKQCLGTSSPRDLAEALSFISPSTYAHRHELLGGVRLLPLGRFFVDGRDVYPRLLAATGIPSNSSINSRAAARR
jgi:intracellular multiplication protein IcmJ